MRNAGAVQEFEDAERFAAFQGFRAWRVKEGRLLSLTKDTAWSANYAMRSRFVDVGVWPLILNAAYVGVAAGVLGLLLAATLVWQVDGQSAYGHLVARSPLDANWAAAFSIATTFGAFLLLLWTLPTLGTLARIWAAVARGDDAGSVIPGSLTPGIYAMRDIKDVRADLYMWIQAGEAGTIVVRGSVWLWGETVEHERAVKGQFGFPCIIGDVLCVRCWEWVAIGEYDDGDGPPIHGTCPVPGSWPARFDGWMRDALLLHRKWAACRATRLARVRASVVCRLRRSMR